MFFICMAAAGAQPPTDGFGIYNDSCYVQKPHDKPLAEGGGSGGTRLVMLPR